jgi:hypothetical protein
MLQTLLKGPRSIFEGMGFELNFERAKMAKSKKKKGEILPSKVHKNVNRGHNDVANKSVCLRATPMARGCQMAYFSNQKSQFGYILEGLAMEDVGIF